MKAVPLLDLRKMSEANQTAELNRESRNISQAELKFAKNRQFRWIFKLLVS
jgi:hypothetical protein